MFLLACFVPFPNLACRQLAHKLELSMKCISFVVRKSCAKFKTPQFANSVLEAAELQAAVELAEKSIRDIKSLLPSVSMEKPFSSQSGCNKVISLLETLLDSSKAMIDATVHFSEENHVGALRRGMSGAVADVGMEATIALENIMEKYENQGNNLNLASATKVLDELFTVERHKFVEQVYGTKMAKANKEKKESQPSLAKKIKKKLSVKENRFKKKQSSCSLCFKI